MCLEVVGRSNGGKALIGVFSSRGCDSSMGKSCGDACALGSDAWGGVLGDKGGFNEKKRYSWCAWDPNTVALIVLQSSRKDPRVLGVHLKMLKRSVQIGDVSLSSDIIQQILEPLTGVITGKTSQVKKLLPKTTKKHWIAIGNNRFWNSILGLHKVAGCGCAVILSEDSLTQIWNIGFLFGVSATESIGHLIRLSSFSDGIHLTDICRCSLHTWAHFLAEECQWVVFLR
ncbi:hypothetical protein P8452_07019 [Trifolium repens]|nr:hypothetical protein P8452_07019 [Trifolium repens]